MLITVSMTREAFREASTAGKKPDFKKVFSGISGVRLVNVFGRGRYAKIEVDDSTLNALEKRFSSSFIFSQKIGYSTY